MKSSNILLITDNNDAWKDLTEKFALLRNSDEIISVDFSAAEQILEEIAPKVIFLCAQDCAIVQETLLNIKKINPRSIVICAFEKYNQDLILSLYDSGMDDYILTDSEPADVLIKTVNALKLSAEREKAELNQNLLENIGALSNGFYTENYADELFENVFESEKPKSATLVILTYDELDKALFDCGKLSCAIKNSIRKNDIAAAFPSGKFYILLENADIEGAKKVYKKIKNSLEDEFRIKAGICEVCAKSFKETEQKSTSALTDAMLSTYDFVIYQEKEISETDDWSLEPEKENKQKDFKFFRQLFLNKMEKVITPVFYKLQNAYDGRLEDTQIEQYTNENRCIFNLKNPKQTSRLTITYPGFAKAVIYITHSGLDSPENKEYVLALKDLTELLLTALTEDFIKDFQNCIEQKEI